MRLFSVKTPDGVLHIPAGEILSVLVRKDGTGIVTFHGGLPPITIKDARAVTRLLDEEPSALPPPRSLFEAIFGK